MERREFISSAVAGAACTLAAAPIINAQETGAADQAPQKKYGVKITVVKREFDKELNEKIKTDTTAPCPNFADNQEFIVKTPWIPPEKFCPWAWADIRTYIHMVNGGQPTMLTCCTDGARPVFFKIERVEM